MLKKYIREIYKKKREQLSLNDKIKADDLILIQFQKLQLPFASVAFSFYPIKARKEVNTFLITDYLKFKNPGLKITYPKTDFLTNTMKAIICDDSTNFSINEFGIPEPLRGDEVEAPLIDIVLVPVLAFDVRGYRVGYGKGFYDRFLKKCREGCLKIGLCCFEPVDMIDDTNEYDVPLNFCITPQKVYVF